MNSSYVPSVPSAHSLTSVPSMPHLPSLPSFHSLETGMLIYSVISVLFALASLITTWRLYRKAGRPGWAAIVPIYNVIVQLDIAKMPMWYLLLLFVPFVNVVVGIMILVNFAKQYNRKFGFWFTYVFLPIIAVFIVGKTEYIGGNTVAAAANPASPAATATSAPLPPSGVELNAEQPANPAVPATNAVNPWEQPPATEPTSAPEVPSSSTTSNDSK